MTEPLDTRLPDPPAECAHDQQELLSGSLASLFGDIDAAGLALLRQQVEWVEVAGGETLMRQGDEGDAVYLVISGRLRVYAPGNDGAPRLLREMARGQVIGELSLITDAPRSPTVLALRDSVLVRLGKPAFLRLLADSGELSLAMTRQTVRCMQSAQTQPQALAPVTMALVPVSEGVDATALARDLSQALAPTARVRVLDADAVDELLQQPGSARADARDAAANGGTFNNFQVDVMRGLRGVGRVIGIGLAPGKARRLEIDEVPGLWALLRDKLRPRARRRFRMPTLATYLLNVTVLYSSSRQRQAQAQTDLYLHPPLERVGMLQWSRFDEIVAQGYAYAAKALDEASAPAAVG